MKIESFHENLVLRMSLQPKGKGKTSLCEMAFLAYISIVHSVGEFLGYFEKDDLPEGVYYLLGFLFC